MTPEERDALDALCKSLEAMREALERSFGPGEPEPPAPPPEWPGESAAANELAKEVEGAEEMERADYPPGILVGNLEVYPVSERIAVAIYVDLDRDGTPLRRAGAPHIVFWTLTKDTEGVFVRPSSWTQPIALDHLARLTMDISEAKALAANPPPWAPETLRHGNTERDRGHRGP